MVLGCQMVFSVSEFRVRTTQCSVGPIGAPSATTSWWSSAVEPAAALVVLPLVFGPPS